MDKQILNRYGVIPANGDVGVEIEMEGKLPFLGREKIPEAWFHTNDGSLRGESAEFVFRKPLKKEASLKAVDDLYSFFANSNGTVLEPSNRCGVHIHINVQSLEEGQVFNMILLYMAMEELMVKWCGQKREGNLFCLRSRDAEEFVMAMAEARVLGSLKNLANKPQFRYCSINVNALAKFGSLEFRALGTPKRGGRIKTWIKMLLALRERACLYENGADIVMDMSAKGADEFIVGILGPRTPILRLSTPERRERMLRSGIRHVQDALLLDPVFILPGNDGKRYPDPFNPMAGAAPGRLGMANFIAEGVIQGGLRAAHIPPVPQPVEVMDDDEDFVADEWIGDEGEGG